MREYKFRGKSIQSFGNNDIGSWFYGGIIINPYSDELHIAYFDKSKLSWRNVPVDPATVGQYSTINLKDGTELYEGDIVEHTTAKWIGVIVFDDGAFRVKSKHGTWALDKLRAERLIKIGNSWDNRDL